MMRFLLRVLILVPLRIHAFAPAQAQIKEFKNLSPDKQKRSLISLPPYVIEQMRDFFLKTLRNRSALNVSNWIRWKNLLNHELGSILLARPVWVNKRQLLYILTPWVGVIWIATLCTSSACGRLLLLSEFSLVRKWIHASMKTINRSDSGE